MSTNIEILYIAMHGFRQPMGYPARFSFLISFILVAIAYRAFLLTDNIDKRGLLAIGISASLFLLSAVFGSQKNNYIISSAVLCAFYVLLFYLSKTGKTKRIQTFARVALFMTTLIELSITSYIAIKAVGTTDRDNYYYGYKQIKSVLNTREKNNVDFYRTDFEFTYDYLQPYLFNYNGVSFFSSTINLNTMKFFQGLGLNSTRQRHGIRLLYI